MTHTTAGTRNAYPLQDLIIYSNKHARLQNIQRRKSKKGARLSHDPYHSRDQECLPITRPDHLLQQTFQVTEYSEAEEQEGARLSHDPYHSRDQECLPITRPDHLLQQTFQVTEYSEAEEQEGG